MADSTFYIAPACWHYRNGDKIFGATVRKNVNDEYDRKRNRKILTFCFATDSYSKLNEAYGMELDSDIVDKKRLSGYHQSKIYNCTKSLGALFTDNRKSNTFNKKLRNIGKIYCSVPSFNTDDSQIKFTVNSKSKSCHQMTMNPTGETLVENTMLDRPNSICFYTNINPFSKLKYKVYRCQLNTQEESCCCSCNSDAMFEVMKSLYDCYKKKNCDNCNCILCGHLPREERKLGELRKSEAKLSKRLHIPSGKLRKAKAAGMLTPLTGKSEQEKHKILRGLAMQGIPLPEAKTPSEQKLMDRVRAEVGLPPEPKSPSAKEKYNRAMAAGLITPLEGKRNSDKEKILREQAKIGLPLPEGRTPSEKALIAKIKETTQPESVLHVPSEKLRKAKAAGLLTPLTGKSEQEKHKILRGLAMQGIPLPEAKTPSEQRLMDRVRAEVGLPPEPKSPSDKEKYNRAMAAGIITPLEGKRNSDKEKILREQAKIGLPLPEGRTPSEKALIAKIKETTRPESVLRVPSEKLRKAKAAGLLTPLTGKSEQEKHKILRGLAMQGIPLPEAKTPSEQKLMDRVRAEVGLPPEPKSLSAKEKYNRAMAAGLITPLEGKRNSDKEKILREQAKMGLPLPEGRTPSEKALIAKIKESTRPESVLRVPSEKLRKAKAAGLLTPLTGKSEQEKHKILRGLAMQGIPLPEAKTPSEQKLMDRVRAEVGLPPEPKSPSAKEKYNRAMAAGLITPLEGKRNSDKEKILREQAKIGIPLPEGRTPSEKALIAKIKESTRPESVLRVPSEKLRKAKAAGLLTPLTGKSEQEKHKILRGLAMQGKPLPEAKTPSEQKLMDRVRAEVGLPPEPKSPSVKEKYNRAMAAGLITPLEGKRNSDKEKILREQAKIGLPLPEGRTPSEKALIAKVKATTKPLAEMPFGRPPLPPEKLKKLDAQTAKVMKEKKGPSDECICDLLTPESERKPLGVTATKSYKIPSEKLRKAKAAGLLTPLTGKSKQEKEKILRGLAMHGIPLPEAKTSSEQKLMDRVRAEVGLPPEPKSPSAKEKYNRAMAAGLITPLEGKRNSDKEKILREQAKIGLPLPEGRTPSEKALIAKIKETMRPESVLRVPSEKLRKAKAAGLLTPLTGKSKQEKEKILRGLAMHGIPLPEAKTSSEQKLMDRVRAEVGLPPEPKSPSAKEKYNRAMAAGLITPLEGKRNSDKEKILREQAKIGLPLPEGRTPSEKALIAKIKETTRPESVLRVPSEKLRKAKAAGLLTPLTGKSKQEKEKILRGLAMHGIPLPEAKTSSEQKLMDRVRAEVGLPPEPKSPSAKEKYNRAMAAGLITPLEGKRNSDKEKILREQAKIGLPLPEGRTPSEKALIAKIKETTRPESVLRVPSEKLRKAKAAGLLTPLTGKSKQEKEKILRGLAMHGIPLPEAKTSSEQKLMDRVRAEVGLPPEPKSPSAKEKYNRAMAAGLITPLEGKRNSDKEKILREQAKIGLPLPEGRTPSEKALIAKIKETTRPESVLRVPSEKLRKAKAAGLLTPLTGKSKQEKEKILRGLAMHGIPLPEAKTSSEQKLMDRVRAEVGLPPEPKSPSAKEKYNRAMAAGLITPLEGKRNSDKEKILREQAKIGLPLPEGRTPSEKALIAKIKETTRPESVLRVPSEKLRKAKAAGLLTPLTGKSKQEKEKILRGLAMHGIPLPEAKTSSEQKLMDRVRAEVGLPPEPKSPSAKEKYNRAMAAGLITPLEGKRNSDKEKILREQAKIGLPLPEGRTPSEKALIAKIKETTRPESVLRVPSEKLRKAKAAGLLTPLTGKSKQEKEKILRGLAMHGIPLPEAKTSSEQKLMDRVRAEVGLPPEPKSPSAKEKYNRAMAAGLITPLEGKRNSDKEKILREQAKIGLPLPEGRTPSEKALIAKIKETTRPESVLRVPSEKLRKAKAAGLLTPLTGKSKQEKEKILRGLAMHGIPLPEAKTSSEQKLMDRVRAEVGLPPEPKSPSAKEKYNRAMAAGLITPLEGKRNSDKEKILREQAKIGLPLPEGRTPSEKALIAKIKETTRPESVLRVPSEKLRKAKAAGLLTPLTGKSKQEKEKILRGLAMHGIPLPEAKTSSEQKLMDRVRAEVGLPPEPKSPSAKEKYNRAMAAGLITPLEGKRNSDKEKILREQAKIGLPLPEGRTPSEKALIAKIKETTRPESVLRVPSEKLRKAKAAGLLTPLTGKSKQEKEKILRGLAMHGIPLPEAKTSSEQKLMDRVRAEVGLPPEPKSPSAKEKYNRAMAAGLITPLEGKRNSDKEKILREQAKIGLPLPEGRTPSEKALIAKIKETTRPESVLRVPSEKLRKAKAAGLLTPLTGKSKQEKEKILRGLAMHGIPLPEAKTSSEQKLMDRVRAEVGLPPEPKSPSAKEKYNRAMAAGLITPLEGKRNSDKEKILREQAKIGLPLPEGRTPSEKALIAKVKATPKPLAEMPFGRPPLPPEKLKKLDAQTAKVMKEKKGPSGECICDLLTPESERKPLGVTATKSYKIPSEKLRKAKAAGLLTPLTGKSKQEKEKILRGLAMHGIPLPEAKTSSDQKLMDRVRAEVGLPPEPKSPSAKEKYSRAMAAGLITPLEGKRNSDKEKILREQAKIGLPLPEGRTPSEKALIAKIKETTRPESVLRVPSEKLRKAKAAGLLTPLTGKSKQEKEKILRGLAMHGIPLPEAKTSSEQKLMDRVRAEVGLPPEPKSPSAKEKYNRAMAAGLITPLEGKRKSDKEKILREQAKIGLPLPEGRTPSEKALIAKIKETTRPESVQRVPSEKLRKAKAAGLLTPLTGKSEQEKHKILRGLAMQGIPLPEAKTPSEQKLMDRVRAEVGLPPEPKSPSDKEKYNRAMAAGIITPLEGKRNSDKEKILREQAKIGLPLPEGRTPSEKALIAKIKETTRPESVLRVPSEKLRKAKAAGLLTPLTGKNKQEKEKILRGLAMHGIPLPEAKTSSEQKLMDRVRAEVGLPPEPKSPSAKEKYNRAMAAGLITPLEGKRKSDKEKILREQAKIGLPLPEGRTPSEKALIAKIKETTRPESVQRVPSEKLRKAKAAGLLTPLTGKSEQEKHKILRGLAMQGIPLPEAKTPSEQKLMDRVRAEVGLPPEPKSPSAKEKYNRAMAAGIITPLEGKRNSDKEKILREQAKIGLPLPEGRTPSEKALIAKIKETTRPESVLRVPSEKLRKVKAAGLLTPLTGKSEQEKHKILRGLAMQGKPLPEAKTPSEQKLMDRVRAEVGLPPEPKSPSGKEKYNRAMAAGLITPLEGKRNSDKEKILREQAKIGLPLPEGRTPSEKALIAKVKATTKPLAEMPFGRPPLPPEKLKKLDAQTAKVMKEKKGPSDECICDLLTPESERKPLGVTATKSYKIPSEKLRKAKAAGLLTPLTGKSEQEKHKILRGLAMQGIPLPEAKTPSEQKLMDRVRAEVGLPPEPKSPSAKEKYNRAMAAGIITPLEGKRNSDKEKILREQAKIGLPLPEGRTPSEKALIAKIKETTSIASSIVPIPSEKLRKAKAAGLLTPLEGKSAEQKEKILSGLAEAGLPLPKGKTSSEKSLIRKIQTKFGIPPKAKTGSEREISTEAKAGWPLQATLSEKRGKIRKKSKKIGVSKSKGGIVEEFEDITKTTTCDRACGCDKKKIRFKHSYVKIRVTSPDISSLCPCPEECVPGVKGGVFTDNEGIKVTIGRVTGVLSFPSRELPKNKRTLPKSYTSSQVLVSCTPSTNNPTDDIYCGSSQTIPSYNDVQIKNSKLALNSPPQISDVNACPNSLYDFHKDDTIIFIKSFTSTYGKPHLLDNDVMEESYTCSVSTSSSIESFYLLKTDSSLSLATYSDTYSVISISVTETSSCSDYSIQKDYLSSQYDKIFRINENFCSTFYTSGSTVGATDVYSTTTYWSSSKRFLIDSKKKFDREIILLKAIQSEHLRNHRRQESSTKYDFSTSSEILDTVSREISKRIFYDSSSLIIIMPTSSDEYETNYNNYYSDYSLEYSESTVYIQLSKNCTNWNPTSQDLHQIGVKNGLNLVAKGKHLKNVSLQKIDYHDNLLESEKQKKSCRKSRNAQKSQRVYSTDTTEDRPCCCVPMEENGLQTCLYGKEKRYENFFSELANPMVLKEASAQGVSHEPYTNAKHQKNYLQQSCMMPPSGRHSTGPTGNPKMINDYPCNEFKDSFSPDKAKKLLEKSTKQSTCVSFGDHCKDNIQETRPKTDLTNTSCNVSDKPNIKREESNKKPKNTEEKSCCPCSFGSHIKTTRENAEEKPNMKNGKTRNKKNKNILCECPEDSHPEFQFNEEDWIDETQIRKMKSDLTQTVSGFKLNVPRKIPEPEISFEEIMKFYAENAKQKYGRAEPEHIQPQAKKNAAAVCRCPPAEDLVEEDLVEEPPADSEEPLQGIKFHIGGKGSGSKGLAGILCF